MESKVLGNLLKITFEHCVVSDAGTEGARGGATDPLPIFGRSVNPIPTRVVDSAHPLLVAPPFFANRHT